MMTAGTATAVEAVDWGAGSLGLAMGAAAVGLEAAEAAG